MQPGVIVYNNMAALTQPYLLKIAIKVQVIDRDKTVGSFIKEQVKQFRIEVTYLSAPHPYSGLSG
ncbi:hypothetical protein [Niabella hibiscisoli]|uniref:hypothetical protein n=1 Tax=Niabella hibiscisoli TaxID=1825928 RepID=UPI001F0D80B3|nr:hypothetical protein [Niabella hibiscisoli]MCH5719100.1 hypothetical protein [Niabella hibiscisoli]